MLQSITDFEHLLDSEEAAAMLKIHPKTLQKLARRGEIIGMQIGKLWRFRASSLNAWLLQKMATRADDPIGIARSTLPGSPAILSTAIRVASIKGEK
ncbi:MAG: helix-turn-helix domain-containing protein [Candidatus Acidiferrum sp.]|jgi:excisionase family DNA binding protein